MATNYGTSAYQSKTQKAFTASQAALDAKRGTSYNAADIAAGARAILKPTTTPTAPVAKPENLFPDTTNPIQQKLDAKVDALSPTNKTGTDLLNQELATSSNDAFKLTGATTPASAGQLVQQQKDLNAQQQQRLQQQQQAALDIQGLQYQQAQNQMNAASAANTANLAQGREGVMSAGAPLAVQQYQTVLAQNKAIMDTRVAQTNNELMQARADLERAQNEGNATLATNIQNRIGALEDKQKQNNLEALQVANQASDLALKQAQLGATEKQNATTSLINTFEKMGEGMVNLTDEQITAMVDGTSITAGAALAWRAGEALKAKAAKSKDALEQQKLLAEAQKLQAEVKLVGKPADVQTYEYFNQLSDQGKADFKNLLAINRGSQIVKGDDGTIYGYDPTNGTLTTLKTTGEESDTPDFSVTPVGVNHAVKNNNPGNLRSSSLATGTKDGFALFPDVQTGYQALINDIQAKQTGKSKTGINGNSSLIDFISVYAPKGDSNNPVAYAAAIASNTGLPVTTPIKDIDTAKLAKEIIRHEDGDMFKALYGGGSSSSAEKAADEIMKPYSTATIATYPKAQQEKITEILNKRKAEALASGDTLGVIRASAGGAKVDTTAVDSFVKAKNVISQLGDLENNVMAMDTGPITGIFKSANPYDVDAVKLKAQLQAIVPNLARGIYGEVGVLTDQDINNYIKTLPNAKSTDDQKKALLNMTRKIIADSIANKASTYAELGYDVSGLAKSIEKISPDVSAQSQQTPVSKEAEDAVMQWGTPRATTAKKFGLKFTPSTSK